ncbi:MAG: hypothetical protein U9N45_05240, partial [Gemmatimonadota bacterium]|nr:hypothetical protein [Gemmatimonadota bacterium]
MDKEKSHLEESFTSMPKVELHIHFEGTVTPDLLARIAGERTGMTRAGIGKMFDFHDFKGFLQAFRRVNELLTEPGDFYHIARALSRRLRGMGVVYAELTFTPLIHTRLGLNHAETMGSILDGCRLESEAGGPRVAFIYDTVRQWGAEAALETAELAVADQRAGLPVVGFGVGGDELSTPAEELKGAFTLAADAGLRRVVHAGEAGGPDSVWHAVETLGADRIGHGIAALQ